MASFEEPGGTKEGAAAVRSANVSIVVADDNAAVLDLLVLILQDVADRVISFSDGRAAWRAIQTQRPDVAILDAYMPGLDGVDITRQLRADPALAGTRVLLITGDPDARAAAEAAGADAWLPKPFLPSGLIATVRELLADRAA